MQTFDISSDTVLICCFFEKVQVDMSSYFASLRVFNQKTLHIGFFDGKLRCFNSNEFDSKKEIKQNSYLTESHMYPSDGCPCVIQELNEKLKQTIEIFFEIKVVEFETKWNFSGDNVPFLVEVSSCKVLSDNYLCGYLDQIASYVFAVYNYEFTDDVCFTNRLKCSEANYSCPRNKVENYRLAKFVGKTPVYDRNSFQVFVKSFITKYCVKMLMQQVSICSSCFNSYRNAVKRFVSPLSPQLMLRQLQKYNLFPTGRASSQLNRSPPVTAVSTPGGGSTAPGSPILASFQKVPKPYKVPKARLRLTQNYSLHSYKKSHNVHSSNFFADCLRK